MELDPTYRTFCYLDWFFEEWATSRPPCIYPKLSYGLEQTIIPRPVFLLPQGRLGRERWTVPGCQTTGGSVVHSLMEDDSILPR